MGFVFLTISPTFTGEAFAQRKKHVMESANAGLDIPRSELRKLSKIVRQAVREQEIPPGWRQLSGGQIRKMFSGKSFRSHYLYRSIVVDYAFWPNGQAKRRFLNNGGNQQSRWTVEKDILITWGGLRFEVYSNGRMNIIVRYRHGRPYAQALLPGRPIKFGINDTYK